MRYKKKVSILFVLNFCLLVFYGLTLFFDPQRTVKRNSAYSWLEERFISSADRIEIYGIYGSTILSRKNNIWVISATGQDFPVKQIRVEELFRSLSRRKSYPLRSSASAPERLGFDEGASRIIVRGGAGLPLLDLLIGFTDASGRDVYLRKAGQKEIRSGEDIFSVYTESNRSFWYDLRIFPELLPSMVQKVHLLTAGESSYILSRQNSGWINERTGEQIPGAGTYLSSILALQGEDFVDLRERETALSLVLELGDGSFLILRVSPPDTQGCVIVSVSGSPLSYLLSEWSAKRLWPSFFGENPAGVYGAAIPAPDL